MSKKDNEKILSEFQNGTIGEESVTSSDGNDKTGFDKMLEKFKANLPADVAEKLTKAIETEMAVPPKVAIIGKSGTGKTTTINNLFNVEWHTSESITGTTEAQREIFKLKGEGKLEVIDMPGLGDSIANDLKFIEIYKDILPESDVILYVIQADDRGLGEDERIIRDVVLKCGKNLNKKLVIAINKVDLLGENEGLEWDERINLPSIEQEDLINRKCEDTIKRLSHNLNLKKDAIVYYSAVKRYHLYQVLYAIVMHSGNTGWKFAIDPKDWTELMDEKYKKIAHEMNKN